MWRELGPAEARERLTAMLRTAVLLGQELILDRNQILDGIYFLSVGPEGIAHLLGLAPWEPLPITMTGQDPPEAADDPMPVAFHRGRDGVGPDAPSLPVGFQLDWVRTERFLTASSALAAILPDIGTNSWLYPTPSDAWYPGAGLCDVLHPLGPDDRAHALALIRDAQDAWARACVDGRVAVDSWRGAIDMVPALHTQRTQLAAVAGERGAAPLAEHVLEEETNVRKVALETIVAFATDRGWTLDAAHPDPFEDEMRMAVELWSRAYYRAIADRDDTMLIAFNDATGADRDDMDLLRSYGLHMPVRSAVQRWWQRRTGGSPDELRVDGMILDDMRVIDPGTFNQLTRRTDSILTRFTSEGPTAMYDLAMLCRDAIVSPDTRSDRRKGIAGRIVTMSAFALIIAVLTLLTDLMDLSAGTTIALVVAATVLGILSSLPWEDIAAQFELRDSAMTATLDLAQPEWAPTPEDRP